MLTPAEVAVINAARAVLKDVADRARVTGRQSDTRPLDAVSYGMLGAYADAAEEAAFQTLNIASAHGITPLSESQLHNRSEA
jgi:hypothetical protein